MGRAGIPSPMTWNTFLANVLADQPDANVLRHFVGFPILGAPTMLNNAAIVCLDIEWWQMDPKPTTEIGIAELLSKGVAPSTHAENILMGVQAAHARLMDNAHLLNSFKGAGDPEVFSFGTSKFVTAEEAKQVIINTFVRPRHGGDGSLQPIILVGHAVDNEFNHIQEAFGVDLRSYGTIVKVVDTQVMAREAGIQGPNGPSIGLNDLLAYFNVSIENLHTAGNDAAATLIAAVLIVLKDGLYPLGKPPAVVQGRHIQDVVERVMAIGKSSPPPPWGRQRFCTRCDRENHVRANCFAKVNCEICRTSGVKKLYNAHLTHATSKCTYNHYSLPLPDHGSRKVTPAVLPLAEGNDLSKPDA
ncbi:hypothetical protein BDU57DRAFT_506163 [Ampelomyces quisqualis]|uniref:Gfd2/YDR514C-like C-terminal domain-containing protein n=1 Tax=Ampelomyces quisqualis TaxID=50730 RepID=A0A6A5QBL2_AMPQU|nr:hypothetical protein BDU57DRAFT_506163 [Ampelomyces quisqualis]